MKHILLLILCFYGNSLWAQNKIERYQHWFNHDHSGAQTVQLSVPQQVLNLSAQLNTEALPQGLHTVHIRFQDTQKSWSSAQSQFFYKLPTTLATERKLTHYQYWFNKTDPTTGTTADNSLITLDEALDATALPNGLHTFHIRFRDNQGLWSSTLSQFFYKIPVEIPVENKLTQYQYWFNSGEAITGTTLNNKLITLNETLDASTLSNGLHTFHIRFRDTQGLWSSTLSQFFYKLPMALPAENKLTHYQYWFNSSEPITGHTTDNQLITLNEALDATALSNGLHTFHIRFRDKKGLWSSTLSQFFYKMPALSITDNLVKSYQYWFDDQDEKRIQVQLENPVNPLDLAVAIETPYLNEGEHHFHIQFQDTHGRWSSVLSQAFAVDDCSPRFTGIPEGDQQNCGGTITGFTVKAALNVTDFAWAIIPEEAGSISSSGAEVEIHWASQFAGEATVQVTGSNPCGSNPPTGLKVDILPAPRLTAMDDTAICEGEEIELKVTDLMGTLSWNVPNPLVSPLQTTTYIATATNSCGTATDEVTIKVISIDARVEQNGIELTAMMPGATYQWVNCEGFTPITGAQGATFTPATGGRYAVMVSMEHCSAYSECYQISFTSLNEQHLKAGIRLYPNPARHQLTLAFENPAGHYRVRMLDMNARVVQHETPGQGQTHVFDTGMLKPGVYLLEIRTDNDVYRYRFIKE